MENETIAKITTLSINDEFKNKKIEISLDIINDKLIFKGFCKIKMNSALLWRLFAEEKLDVKNEDTENINFEKISKSIYNTMIERINTFELVQAFMHEVNEIEIKE